MNGRPSRSETLMKTAYLWSERSTCNRLGVGAVITTDGRPIGQGYNGPPSGMAHCEHEEWEGPCRMAIHAEANAIAFAARRGTPTFGAEMFVTHSPCVDCAKLIIQSGIVVVHFDVPFREPHGIELLEEVGIVVNHLAT